MRNRKIGFVFQFHHLLREFTALENVMMPLLIAGDERRAGPLAGGGAAGRGRAGGPHDPPPVRAVGRRAAADRGGARAGCRSAWSCWRTSRPATWTTRNSERLHELFARLAREFETALVVVTHNRLLAGRADRVLSLDGGRLVPLAGVESMP